MERRKKAMYWIETLSGDRIMMNARTIGTPSVKETYVHGCICGATLLHGRFLSIEEQETRKQDPKSLAIHGTWAGVDGSGDIDGSLSAIKFN